MPDGEPSGIHDEDELEITNLRPHQRHLHVWGARSPKVATRTWRRRALGLSLVLLAAALLISLLVGRTLSGSSGASIATSHSPTTTTVPITTETVSAALPPPPVPPLPAPTPLPGIGGSGGAPALGPAPSTCGGAPPALTQTGPPWGSEAIGRTPVLLGGFIGPYATMPLGPAASNTAYGWTAPYTPYGWPAPIGLVVRSGTGVGPAPGPVTLSGRDLRTGHPLWFGFIVAGQWSAPQRVVPDFTIDPAHPSVFPGGSTTDETFWYGYAFLPGAGCYTLAATWPGGGWHVTVSAGTVSTVTAGQ